MDTEDRGAPWVGIGILVGIAILILLMVAFVPLSVFGEIVDWIV